MYAGVLGGKTLASLDGGHASDLSNVTAPTSFDGISYVNRSASSYAPTEGCLTKVTIQPSSLRSPTLFKASETPWSHLNFPPKSTTALRLRSSASGSRAVRFASAASASLTSASAASAADNGGGEAIWFRCADRAAGVKSF